MAIGSFSTQTRRITKRDEKYEMKPKKENKVNSTKSDRLPRVSVSDTPLRDAKWAGGP